MMLHDLGVELAAVTAAGRRRRNNADAYLIDEDAGLLALSDGMGDTPRSAAVAKMALDAVGEMFLDPWRSLPAAERSIQEALERLCLGVVQANTRLFVPAAPGSERRSGATVVGAVLCPRHLCVASVGDSRLYLLPKGGTRVERLTRDDTVLETSLRLGVPYAAAIAERDAHALTRAIGVRPAVQATPVVHRYRAGDVVLLCSDGVSDRVRDDEIAEVLAGAVDLERAAHLLVERAKAAGGWDDATVVIARRAGGAAVEGDREVSVCDSGVRRIDVAHS